MAVAFWSPRTDSLCWIGWVSLIRSWPANRSIMSDTRYLILLPLKFPEGQRVPADYITETQIELARRFGGATLEPGRVSGMWVDEGQLVEDELVKLWTDV